MISEAICVGRQQILALPPVNIGKIPTPGGLRGPGTVPRLPMNKKTSLLLAGALSLLMAVPALAADDDVIMVIATLNPTAKSDVKGQVTFTKEGDGVKIVADVTGLKPGKHGFHIHEFGDCSAPDATSAGGHFNPTDDPHAGHDAEKRHMGDMGNIEADATGKAHVELTDKMMNLKQIVGHAVIVHEKADDLKSQPTGDAGGRVACGVIGYAKAAGDDKK